MVDARWQFFLIMRYHNHGFVLAATEGFDDVFYKTAVAVVESVERFIENQQFRILDKGSCQENEALFAAGELQETTVFKTFQSEDFHPEAALVHIFFLRLYIEAYGIHQAACHDADGWQVALVRAVKLRRYVADVFLDVPDAFAAASRIVEEGDVAGITLRIIGTNQTEERYFFRLRSVRSKPIVRRSSRSSRGR